MDAGRFVNFWLGLLRLFGGFPYSKITLTNDSESSADSYDYKKDKVVEKETDNSICKCVTWKFGYHVTQIVNDKTNQLHESQVSFQKSRFWLYWSKFILFFDICLVCCIPSTYCFVYWSSEVSKTMNTAEAILILTEMVCLFTMSFSYMLKPEDLLELIRNLRHLLKYEKKNFIKHDILLIVSLCLQVTTIVCYVVYGLVHVLVLSLVVEQKRDIVPFTYFGDIFESFIFIWKILIMAPQIYLFYTIVNVLGLHLEHAINVLITSIDQPELIESPSNVPQLECWCRFLSMFSKEALDPQEQILVIGDYPINSLCNSQVILDKNGLSLLQNELFKLHLLQESIVSYFSLQTSMILLDTVIGTIVGIFSLTYKPLIYSCRSLLAATSIMDILLFNCSPVYFEEQRERLRLILVRMQLLTTDADTLKEISNTLALMNEYQGFNMGRYFVLSKARLVEVLGFVATYIVILHQFQTSEDLGEFNHSNFLETFNETFNESTIDNGIHFKQFDPKQIFSNRTSWY